MQPRLRLKAISIHAFRRECDGIWMQYTGLNDKFQSTHSAGNATPLLIQGAITLFISIHAFRRECDVGQNRRARRAHISIHAFRRECDGRHHRHGRHYRYFNPRIPQGMRQYLVVKANDLIQFQSTHSAGNATASRRSRSRRFQDFNPRIPQGMRLSCRSSS